MPEPQEAPTLDDLAGQLESGAPPPVSVDPFAGQAPDGLMIEMPGQRDRSDETVKADDVAARIDELERDLQRERKRRTDAGAEYYRANQAREIAEGVVQSLQQVREQERIAMEQIAHSQPPDPGELEAFAEDPAKIVDYVRNVAKWSVGSALAAMQPAWQQMQTGAATLQYLVASAQAQARERARREVEDMGYDDFSEIEGELTSKFREYGYEGEQMMLDPEKLVNGYLMLRRQKGLPMASSRANRAPDVLPDQPRMQSAAAERAKSLGPMASHIANMIGIEKIRATPEDLQRVGLTKE